MSTEVIIVKIIAVGNPGAGKSCFLNSLAGEPVFKSGLNIGSGVTYELDERETPNGYFVDTPGKTSWSFRFLRF